VITHPIQYYVPFFRQLSQKIELKVFYTWQAGSNVKFDPGFGKEIKWDIPLLDGYSYCFVENTAKKQGSSNFWGIQNPSLKNAIQNWGATQILVYGWAYKSHLELIYFFKGKIPVYFRGDSTVLDHSTFLKSFVRKVLLRWVYSKVDYALYVGEANKAYFKKYGLNENQLIFVPHVVDNEFFSKENEQRKTQALEKRKALGISENDFVILFAGKLEPKKNPLILLQAFKEIDLANIHLIYCGEGELKETLINSSKSHKNVHFIPFQNQSEMPVIYRMGDVFCLPSQGPGETWGLAINESLASGTPVIVSSRCGCALNLINSKTGLIFESNNLGMLIKSILTIFDKKKRNSFKFNPASILEIHSLENAVNQTLKLLQNP
jgi:glycosyltransferase involved in cell wall biosynthesis